MQIGPVTLDGHDVRPEPVSLAHVPALWHAGAHEEIWRYLPYTMRSEEDMRAYVASELILVANSSERSLSVTTACSAVPGAQWDFAWGRSSHQPLVWPCRSESAHKA